MVDRLREHIATENWAGRLAHSLVDL